MDDGRDAAGAPSEAPAGFIPLRLVVRDCGSTVVLKRPEMVLGRHSESDVCLRLPDVSRKHCRFVFSAGFWRVFDLQSMNGLFVNDRRVMDAALQHDDIVRIGSYVFSVDLKTMTNSPATSIETRGDITEIVTRRLAS
jgi:pSer/pThr/pTyr-binding forkhead associated (FHA) protein